MYGFRLKLVPSFVLWRKILVFCHLIMDYEFETISINLIFGGTPCQNYSREYLHKKVDC